MKTLDDTITAIATAPGEAGVGIVRVSGPLAFTIAEQVFDCHTIGALETHHIYYGRIVDPTNREALDDALLLTFRSPHSYTGQDVIEFSCHGGSVTLRRVLALCLRQGARMAEAGEFTERAFLNGRLDLAQAEAVADIIKAQTDAQHRIAFRQREGSLSRSVAELSERLMSVLVRVEAVIDFSEDIGELDYEQTTAEVEIINESVEKLLATADQGRIIREGLKIAIIGKPNVGKSSLLNSLLGYERAIVTPVPGTTRDVVEDTISLGGVPVILADTAGVRETDDVVESVGVKRTQKSLAEADLALFIFAAPDGLTDEDRQVWLELNGKPVIPVINKVDTISTLECNVLQDAAENFIGETLAISAMTGEGIEDLRQTIIERTIGSGLALESVSVTNTRHQEALRQTKESLDLALNSLQSNMTPDLVSIDLRGALDSLGLISGETVTEDLIERIFRDFCIGK